MFSGNRAIERAEAMVAMERDLAVNRIRRDMEKPGTLHCVICDDEIAPARRAAMPSARRCATCQKRRELAEKRGR